MLALQQKVLSQFLNNCFFGLNSYLTENIFCVLLRGPVMVKDHKYRQVTVHSFFFFCQIVTTITMCEQLLLVIP